MQDALNRIALANRSATLTDYAVVAGVNPSALHPSLISILNDYYAVSQEDPNATPINNAITTNNSRGTELTIDLVTVQADVASLNNAVLNPIGTPATRIISNGTILINDTNNDAAAFIINYHLVNNNLKYYKFGNFDMRSNVKAFITAGTLNKVWYHNGASWNNTWSTITYGTVDGGHYFGNEPHSKYQNYAAGLGIETVYIKSSVDGSWTKFVVDKTI